MKKLIVFDLDGTLNQTKLYAVKATQKALAEYGITDKSEEEIISYFGARPEDYAKHYFSDPQTQQAFLKSCAQYESQLIQTLGKPFDGISELLNKLKSEQYLLAICSNSSHRYITMVLDTLHLLEQIDYIQPLLPNLIKDDTLRLLLQQVCPDKAVMIGDRIYDKQAANHNQIPFIGCGYGYNRTEILDADFVAEVPLDIYDGTKQLIG